MGECIRHNSIITCSWKVSSETLKSIRRHYHLIFPSSKFWTCVSQPQQQFKKQPSHAGASIHWLAWPTMFNAQRARAPPPHVHALWLTVPRDCMLSDHATSDLYVIWRFFNNDNNHIILTWAGCVPSTQNCPKLLTQMSCHAGQLTLLVYDFWK